MSIKTELAAAAASRARQASLAADSGPYVDAAPAVTLDPKALLLITTAVSAAGGLVKANKTLAEWFTANAPTKAKWGVLAERVEGTPAGVMACPVMEAYRADFKKKAKDAGHKNPQGDWNGVLYYSPTAEAKRGAQTALLLNEWLAKELPTMYARCVRTAFEFPNQPESVKAFMSYANGALASFGVDAAALRNKTLQACEKRAANAK